MKNVGLSFTSFVVGLLCAFLFMAVKNCNHDSTQTKDQLVSDINSVKKLDNAPIIHWIDPNGKDHATKEEAEISSQAVIIAYKGRMDSMAHLLKIKAGAIKGYSKTAFIDTGTLIMELTRRGLLPKEVIRLANGKVDTIQRHFEWVDPYTFIEGDVGKQFVEIKYEFDDTLEHVEYVKKKWFFGKERLYMDAHLQNPKAYVRGMSGVRIGNPMPGRWNLGPYIGYDVTHGTFGFGLSLQYALLRF